MLDAAMKEQLLLEFIRAGVGMADARRAVRGADEHMIDLRRRCVHAALKVPGATPASVARVFGIAVATVRRIAAEPATDRRRR